MGLLRQLFGKGRDKGSTAPSGGASSHAASTVQSAAAHDSRKELLVAAVRDTLAHNGLPISWISAEILSGRSRTGISGFHLRLVLRHWDPRLMVRLVPLQNAVLTRLHKSDPVAEQWLFSVAWQILLPDEAACPPLPHPGSWTADERKHASAPPAASAEAGLIEGPVQVGGRQERHDLDRLLAEMDAKYRERADDRADAPTEPMYLKTQPAPLRDDG